MTAPDIPPYDVTNAEWRCDWKPDDLNPGPECPYCAGEMCGRLDGLGCTHNREERHGYDVRKVTAPDIPRHEGGAVTVPRELVGVSCDYDTAHGPCIKWSGHYGLHVAMDHEEFCSNCGECRTCAPTSPCYVQEFDETHAFGVRLPRHEWQREAGIPEVSV